MCSIAQLLELPADYHDDQDHLGSTAEGYIPTNQGSICLRYLHLQRGPGMSDVLYWLRRRYTHERHKVRSNLKAPPAERCFDGSPSVPPDGQEEHDIYHDKNYGIDGATGRAFVRHLSLDHQRQEVGEKNHQTSLLVHDAQHVRKTWESDRLEA